MRVTFVLPGAGHKPVGGFKVVYEYANRLTELGHRVAVVHAANPWVDCSTTTKVRNLSKYIAFSIGANGGFRPKKWFKVSTKVDMLWVPSLFERWIPDADVIIATSWQTAECIARYGSSKGRKFNLIQHQESFFDGVDAERVMKTWKLPIHKIVIAKWLQEAAAKMCEESVLLPNGLDFKRFGMDADFESRDDARVMMLYHHYAWKGSHEGIAALSIVKEQEPRLTAIFYGVPNRPADLPEWISYHQLPPQSELRKLYNEAAIFISPSWAEGCAAPPAEAMQCGATVCATDIGGHHDYAIDGETGLLSPPKCPEALAKNIMRLIRDRELRIRLAKNGHTHVQQFTWERAVSALEKCLQEGK